MTSFEFGEIVLVPFPFTDQTTRKQRPAVVISSAAYHRDRPDLILLAITSQLRPRSSVGEAALVDWQQAGLLKPSVLKPIVTTIEQQLVRRRLGHLTATDRAALRCMLGQIIG
jgi:mRNA interferase MazF